MIIIAKDSYMIHADRKMQALAALGDRDRFLPAGGVDCSICVEGSSCGLDVEMGCDYRRLRAGKRSMEMGHDGDPALDDEVEPVVPIGAIVKAKCIRHMSKIRS
jgi:hypothetical protein